VTELSGYAALLERGILIVGLGSMGKRRIRNLNRLGIKDIYGYDIRPERNQEAQRDYGITTFESFDEAIKMLPEVLIVATPPDEHLFYGLWGAENRVPFFMEASVISEGISDLIELCKKNSVIGIPSCTPRFHPSIIKMKEIITSANLGKVLSFSHHYGSCYADWHPWEDYRDVYFSKPETGAGRESVPFEMEWLEWLFGEFVELSCFSAKRLDLEPEVIDSYQIISMGKDGVLGNIMIEVTSPYYFRITKGIFSNGVMIWDWRQKKVIVYNKIEDNITEYPEPKPVLAEGYKFEENMYIEEMSYFMDILQGKRKCIYALEDDLRTLKLLEKIEKSAEGGKSVKVK